MEKDTKRPRAAPTTAFSWAVTHKIEIMATIAGLIAVAALVNDYRETQKKEADLALQTHIFDPSKICDDVAKQRGIKVGNDVKRTLPFPVTVYLPDGKIMHCGPENITAFYNRNFFCEGTDMRYVQIGTSGKRLACNPASHPDESALNKSFFERFFPRLYNGKDTPSPR